MSDHPRIPLPDDFDFDEIAGFLRPRAVPSLEHVSTNRYTRAARLDGRQVSLSLILRDGRRGKQWLEARTTPRRAPSRVLAYVRRLLDLGADLGEFRRHVSDDTILAPMVTARPTLRVIQYVDPFEGIIRAILGQQISLAAARTMTDRLVHLAGSPVPLVDDRALLAFPTADDLFEHGASALRALGLTRAKTDALLAVCTAIREERLDWPSLERSDAVPAHALLESIRGVGPWTASYVRMRALADRDAFLPTDMGVVKAMRAAMPRVRSLTTARIVRRAEVWRPWRAYATLHLWRSLTG